MSAACTVIGKLSGSELAFEVSHKPLGSKLLLARVASRSAYEWSQATVYLSHDEMMRSLHVVLGTGGQRASS